MLRHKPKVAYHGLTVVMSNQSRFDRWNLLSSEAGRYFDECLRPHCNRFQLDIRLKEDTSPYLPNTKCILALGEPAQQLIGNTQASIGENRGSPLVSKEGIPVISSYSAQDVVELKDYEGEYNKLLTNIQGIANEFGADEKENALEEKSRHGKTARKNFRFWFAKDIEKAILITQNGGIPKHEFNFSYNIYPNLGEFIPLLLNTKGRYLYFDIETDASLNITCFSFSFGDNEVFVIPLITHNYLAAYDRTHHILFALSVAIRDNTLVAHNGAGFDFLVLAYKYHIPIGKKVYDTMLAQNRCFPEAEKSLGHCISLPWMFEPYHKDEGNFAYGNQEQALALWKYCGKDVSTLILLKKAQDTYATKHVGIHSSIDSVQSYIRSYLTCTLTGIRYSQQVMDDTIRENDRLMMQYLVWLKILVGEKNLKIIRGTGKSSLPGSNKQCIKYFHDMLKYPIQLRSRDTGKASLGKKAMFKLKLKFTQNIVIDIIIAYRKLQKESSSLKFIPYKTAEIQTTL